MHSLVTGGLRGIGRAIVERLLRDGHTVYVFDLARCDDEQAQNLIRQGVVYCSVDVADPLAVKEAFTVVEAAMDKAKHPSLDLLVNNAGITRDNLTIRLSVQDWDQVLAVNLKAAFLCSQQALRRMMRQKKSYIINISSVVGLHGNAGQAHYAASKAGLIAFSKSLAQEYGSRGVRVNAIAPGFITTAMTERLSEEIRKNVCERIALQTLGTPADVANAVAFLCSGEADYISGHVLEVSGGMF